MNTVYVLRVDDLPHNVRLCGSKVPKRFSNFLILQASLAVGHAFLRNSIPSNDHVSMLFFMGGLTMTIT